MTKERMTKDEALKLALKALKPRPGMPNPEYESLMECAIEAIEEVMAQHDSVQAKPEPEQEPVAWMCKRDDGHFDVLTDKTCKKCFPVYTTPPQRTWVGLTDEETKQLWHKARLCIGPRWMVFKRMIEAKLKQKNGFAEEENT